MYFSKHNAISKIRDSEDYYIINFLSKNADILTKEKADEIFNEDYSNIQEYIDKGYLTTKENEEKRFRNGYLDFLDERENEEIQIFYVPTFNCNFNCSYCYQEGFPDHTEVSQIEIIDAFFQYIDIEFAGKRKYITIFGGEPLLNGKGSQEKIKYLVLEAEKRKLGIAVVTNGYNLSSYIDTLKTGTIREVQVTLDGTADIHNKRRHLHSGGDTFNKIVQGIDDALQAGFPVNLRVVLDKENINNLPELAKFAIGKGWTGNPLFKTQFGRNYELHYCQSNESKLFDRIGLYEAIYKLIHDYPEIMEFHRPSFSISRFLFDNGEMPEPLYDSCPGTKTEWAFDFTGNIYSCTATVGKPDEVLGTFFPEVSKKEDIIEIWNDRDITSIPECSKCSVSLACGGGCASAAKNRTGKILSPDCRPVKELLEMGIPTYFKGE